MPKKLIDIIDIKKAVQKGDIKFVIKEHRVYNPEKNDFDLVQEIYCENDAGECVLVGGN